MKHDRTHTHICTTCGQKFLCYGPLEQNHDGFPEVICAAYHRQAQQQCWDCQVEDAARQEA